MGLPCTFHSLLGLLVPGCLASEFFIKFLQPNGSSLFPFITQIQELTSNHIQALTCWEVQCPMIARPAWEAEGMFCQGSDIWAQIQSWTKKIKRGEDGQSGEKRGCKARVTQWTWHVRRRKGSRKQGWQHDRTYTSGLIVVLRDNPRDNFWKALRLWAGGGGDAIRFAPLDDLWLIGVQSWFQSAGKWPQACVCK